MIYVRPGMEWIGNILAEDVFTDQGTLLLAKGHTLRQEDIDNILDRAIIRIAVEERNSNVDEKFTLLYDTCLFTVDKMFKASEKQERIEKETLFEIFDDLIDQMKLAPDLFMQMWTIKDIDQYTMKHSLNVGILSTLLAKLAGMNESESVRVGHAGFLHDIGKALIPSSVLDKPANLDEEEYKQIKQHPKYGYEILLKNEIKDDYILMAALMHHERLSGNGYPFRKKAKTIPLVAQIVAIADVYDAISAERSYKESFSPFHAYMELRQLAFRNELNPTIVIRFLEYISKLMEGKEVLLSDGSVGTVIFVSPYEQNRPLVNVDKKFIDLRKVRDIYIKEFI